MAPILTIFGPNRSRRRDLFFEKFSNERRRHRRLVVVSLSPLSSPSSSPSSPQHNYLRSELLIPTVNMLTTGCINLDTTLPNDLLFFNTGGFTNLAGQLQSRKPEKPKIRPDVRPGVRPGIRPDVVRPGVRPDGRRRRTCRQRRQKKNI